MLHNFQYLFLDCCIQQHRSYRFLLRTLPSSGNSPLSFLGFRRSFASLIPKQKPYDPLRAAVISRTGKSGNEMLRGLFTTVELGDRSPSQMLRHMRSLLCGRKLAVEIMAQLWPARQTSTLHVPRHQRFR
ncbi:hypothetical protein T265_03862 [Opisthorchis viverrini]|uniref:Uncharacterized protein n=1 Tax=Opisthorchis viverrini TaxID=6198 RepID=A0A074ZR20_OPIVI|nr:hypothetical protein T265_03862 [Opisthorchis viverrini]KER29566.1 hypothetical protein T265_03862 [Opisthorchis viverrini]